ARDPGGRGAPAPARLRAVPELRLSGRARLHALPELPPAPEGPVRQLPAAAGPDLVDLPVLRDRGPGHRADADAPPAPPARGRVRRDRRVRHPVRRLTSPGPGPTSDTASSSPGARPRSRTAPWCVL